MNQVRWVMLLLATVAVVGLAMALLGRVRAGARWQRSRRAARLPPGRAAYRSCLSCRGTGWVSHDQRTLTPSGDGFADVAAPATMCERCGGTGVRAG